MTWLSQNGFFVLLLVAFVAMHLFGHGHGGHGGHGDRRRSTRNRNNVEPAHDHGEEQRDGTNVAHDRGNPSQPVASTRDSESRGRHRHSQVF